MSRSLRYLLGSLMAVQLVSSPVLGHGQDHAGDPSWVLWGKITLFALGAVCLAVGIYIDRSREQRVATADYLVIAGFLLVLVGGVSLFR